MFGFVKQVFIATMTFFSFNVLSANSLECVSMKNQESKTRPKIIHVNNIYPYNIRVNKCGGSCNNINDPNAKYAQ